METGAQDKVTNDFVAYATNKDKSKGIFNQDGLMQPNQLNALRRGLRTTESPIWHGIISFEEDTELMLMKSFHLNSFVYSTINFLSESLLTELQLLAILKQLVVQ